MDSIVQPAATEQPSSSRNRLLLTVYTAAISSVRCAVLGAAAVHEDGCCRGSAARGGVVGGDGVLPVAAAGGYAMRIC